MKDCEAEQHSGGRRKPAHLMKACRDTWISVERCAHKLCPGRRSRVSYRQRGAQKAIAKGQPGGGVRLEVISPLPPAGMGGIAGDTVVLHTNGCISWGDMQRGVVVFGVIVVVGY